MYGPPLGDLNYFRMVHSPPKLHVISHDLGEKARYFKIMLTTPGGTEFTLNGRWDGQGLSRSEVLEQYAKTDKAWQVVCAYTRFSIYLASPLHTPCPCLTASLWALSVSFLRLLAVLLC